MKKIMLVLLFAACVSNASAQTESYTSQTYLENHIAITMMKARVISQNEYVMEIALRDFSGRSALPAGFGSEERIYTDDGKGYDVKSSDGIYTTKDKYQFKSADRTNLESHTILVDPNFQHKSEIASDPAFQNRNITPCKFVRVGCPPINGGNCPACRWWGWSCWELTPCGTGFDY